LQIEEKFNSPVDKLAESSTHYSKENKEASQLSDVIYRSSRSKVNLELFAEVKKSVKLKLNHN
jgi:hypothetical protein